MITSLIRPAPNPLARSSSSSSSPLPPQDSPEDILSHSLPLLFPDEARNQHGDPGAKVVYASTALGDMTLELVDPVGEQERRLFAHYVWNAGVMLAELVGAEWARSRGEGDGKEEGGDGGVDGGPGMGHGEGGGADEDGDGDGDRTAEREVDAENGGKGRTGGRRGRWSVEGRTVLELGAGTGLVSIAAVLAGASTVVATDHPTPALLSVLERNVATNVASSLASRVHVRGHAWGSLPPPSDPPSTGTLAGKGVLHGKNPSIGPLSTDFPPHSFQTVLAADTLWMSGQHEDLLRSMAYFLSLEEGARVWVVAGFHTGRRNVAGFLERVGEVGLEVREFWERDVAGEEREWRGRGGGEDGSGGDEVRRRSETGEKEDRGREEKRWCVIGVLGWQERLLRTETSPSMA